MDWGRLARLSRRQFGLFTSGHAARTGVPGYQLSRAAERGTIRRVRHGVYAFTNADEHPFEDLAAQWLAFDPVTPVARRRARPTEIVSHDSAAMMRRLGKINDFGTRQFTASRRVNLHVRHVQMYRAAFGPEDWSIVEGLPVASPLRIVADLLGTPHDGDEVGSVIDEGLATGLFTRHAVIDVADRHADRWSYPGGSDLVEGLLWSMDPSTAEDLAYA